MDNTTVVAGGNATDPSDITADVLQPTAQQIASTILLAPCVVGWILALFGSGYVASVAGAYIAGPLYPKDRKGIKVAAWLVPAFVLMGAGINAQETYHYLVWQQRDYETLADFTVADCLANFPAGMVQGMVQLVLGERACTLIRNRRWKMFARCSLYVLVLSAVSFSLLDVIVSFLQRAGLDYLLMPFTLDIADAVWFSLAAAVDIAVFAVLVTDLVSKLRESAGRQSTDDVLRHLILLAIWTSSTTTVVAVGAAVASAIATNPNDVYVDVMTSFSSILPSLYALAMFNTLRARKKLRETIRGCTCKSHNPAVTFAPLSISPSRWARAARRKGKARTKEGAQHTGSTAGYNSFTSAEEELHSAASATGSTRKEKRIVSSTAVGGINVSVVVDSDGPWRPCLGLDPGDGSYWAGLSRTRSAGTTSPSQQEASSYSGPSLYDPSGGFALTSEEAKESERMC